MSVEENKIIVLRFLEDVWGRGNLNIVEEIVADDHVHHLARRDLHGSDGVKGLVLGFRNFLPDLQIMVNDLIGEG